MRSLRTAVAATLLLAACGGGTDDTVEFDESPARIEIAALSGDISISGNANIEGTSVATVQTEGSPTADITLSDGVLSVGDDCADADGCRMDYSIAVSGDADVSIATGVGNVVVGNTTGSVTIEMEDGALTIATVVGDISVTMGSGDILGTRLQSVMAAFDTGEGDVDVTFDEAVATLTVSTGRGDVTVQLPDGAYAFETEAPDGGVDLLIDNDQAAANLISLATDSGDITVYRR